MIAIGLAASVSRAAVDDDGVYEFGIEWIVDYRDADDLPLCDDDADSVDNVLSGKGWTKVFKKGNGDANVSHWKSDKESDYVDKVDLALFRGHGTKSWDWKFLKDLHGPMFREPKWYDTSDYRLTPGEAYQRYGDKDAEWIAFGCCKALTDGGGGYWAAAFKGAHLILGYETNATHAAYASTWVDLMVSNNAGDPAKRVGYSWFVACDNTQANGNVARIVGENASMINDFLWGQSVGPQADPVVDQYYTRWDHKKGDPITVPAMNRPAAAQTNLPYYEVTPRSITPEYVQQLAAYMGVTGTLVHDPADRMYYIGTPARYLRVSEVEGIEFGRPSDLWRSFTSAPALPPLPDAMMTVYSFLASCAGCDLLPPDATISEARFSDTQATIEQLPDDTFVVIEEYPTYIQVNYPRQINGFPVVGPGGTCMGYVGQGNQVVGFTRAWRPYRYAGDVTILPEQEVRDLFDTYGDKVTVSGVPDAEELVITAASLGYYEHGFHRDQTYIIPVYLLFVDCLIAGSVESSDVVFVPAASRFLPPIAQIADPLDGWRFAAGESVTLEGSAIHGQPEYDYSWSSDLDGFLGDGTPLVVGLTAGTHSITLRVTDSAGGVGEASVTIEVGVSAGSDFDDDGDVDLTDFAHFQTCFNGPNRPYAQSDCADADPDHDRDVDLSDFALFQGCFNGPNRPPACL